MVAKVNTDECTACGLCVEACPVGAITVDDFAVVSPDECTDCGACAGECPSNAITVEGASK